MPREAEAREEWWAEVHEVRERIERRRAKDAIEPHAAAPRRRGVREVRTTPRLSLVTPAAHQQDAPPQARRPRPRPVERIGPRPDRIAAWAVALGLLLLLLAILSAH
jgi:hypothetical protein